MPFIDRLSEETSPDNIKLDEIKNWLKIEHDIDNAILESLKSVAIHEAFNFMQNDFEYKDSAGELVQQPIPFNVKTACLMFIAYLYEQRGDEQTDLPLNCIRLLVPYKKLVGL